MIHRNLIISADSNDYYQNFTLNGRKVGEYNSSIKTLNIFTTQIFRKFKGFGVHEEVLFDERLKINTVEVDYQGITFTVSSEKFKNLNLIHVFTNSTPHDTKYFVPISEFTIKS